MSILDFRYHDYRYFPYELELASLEIERLLGVKPRRLGAGLRAVTSDGVEPLALRRLTYFRDVTVGSRKHLFPLQSLLEASGHGLTDPTKLRRQSTRYSAHGLHEYRGKFNPQMARTAMNLVALGSGARIWDPFCGSGTVLVEALHEGLDALGTDLNPLAVQITSAKLNALRTRPKELLDTTTRLINKIECKYAELEERTACSSRQIAKLLGDDWLERFSNTEYLLRWFSLKVLAQLRAILDVIDSEVPADKRNIYRIVLSDILREVSWQDPRDLRIRRKKDRLPNYPVISLFRSSLLGKITCVVAARGYLSKVRGSQRAFETDTSNPALLPEAVKRYLGGRLDCVLSSPPYATALPYIDTQRLSLALLGLADAASIRKLDRTLIGSREISISERRRLEENLLRNRAGLPGKIRTLCLELYRAIDREKDGFRRHNTPAVVFRYFENMMRAMCLAARSLRKGGSLIFVIGPNRTRLGGTEFVIDTPNLLAMIGETVGLKLCDLIELDTYNRYDLHMKNSIREERLLIMRRTGKDLAEQ